MILSYLQICAILVSTVDVCMVLYFSFLWEFISQLFLIFIFKPPYLIMTLFYLFKNSHFYVEKCPKYKSIIHDKYMLEGSR